MASLRLQRVARQMKQIISRVVTQELKDPRTGFITIVDVKVAPDLKTAQVRFSVLGTDAQKRTATRALDSARGYIQTRVAQDTVLKYTPVISFRLDDSAERDIELSRQIDDAVKADQRVRRARAIRTRLAEHPLPAGILNELLSFADSRAFADSTAALLTRLMTIDTSTSSDLVRTADAERACLDIIGAELRRLWPDVDELDAAFVPIHPDIENDRAYTPPAYAAPPGTDPPPAAQVYAGRGNLVAVLRRAGLEEPATDEDQLPPWRLAFNAHIDTVPPHIPPTRQGDIMLGRGACDAKGQVAAVVGAFAILRHLRDTAGVRIVRDLCAQFVIDEETGGNGSLSLALEDPTEFDAVLICECTDFHVHTANRGCVWYRADLRAPSDRILELAARLVLELEQEGRTIKAESDHPLFPNRPVQTNHGVLGPFGSGPSTVNDHVELEITPPDIRQDDVAQAVERGIQRYVTTYGDKTKELDPQSGQPQIARHTELESRPDALRLTVYGKGGHMGSLAACDSAVTKAAFIIDELARLRATDGTPHLSLAGHQADHLSIEGGQGFLPTHTIDQITSRLHAAAQRAADACRADAGLDEAALAVTLTFDRLHNNAFARPPDSALAVHTTECRSMVPDQKHDPVMGWETSCDARLFAEVFPDRDVIVFGPGQLCHAHSPAERISLHDVTDGAKMLALLVLESVGFVA